MKPDWKDGPSWGHWRCKSSDGMWEFHEYKPTAGSMFWNSTGRIVTVRCADGDVMCMNWMESLEARP